MKRRDFAETAEGEKMNGSVVGEGVALSPPKGEMVFVDEAMMGKGCQAARISPRKRIMWPLQCRSSDSVQRLLNFMQPGTFIRVHCHPHQGHIESVSCLRGRLVVVIFSCGGQVRARWELGPGLGKVAVVDLEHGVWHSMVALEEDTVVFEVKVGP